MTRHLPTLSEQVVQGPGYTFKIFTFPTLLKMKESDFQQNAERQRE